MNLDVKNIVAKYRGGFLYFREVEPDILKT